MIRMMRRFRFVLLGVFAVLQCLAPLLHAHPASAEHHGLHLPSLLSEPGGATVIQAVQPEPEALGLTPALEIRSLFGAVSRDPVPTPLLAGAGVSNGPGGPDSWSGLPPRHSAARPPRSLAPPRA